MAGFIHCLSFRTPTGYITSGHGAADSSFPHAFASAIAHPHRPWKSSGSISIGDTFYGVDMGSAVQLAAAAIDLTNCATVVLEAASSSDFASNLISLIVPVSSYLPERGLFTTSQGVTPGRLKVFVNLAGTDFAGQSRRYWRWRAGAASLDSAEPQFVIGSAIWCRSIVEWASGTSSYEEVPLESTRLNDDYVGGGADPVATGNPYSSVTLAGSPADREAMRADLMALLREGVSRPFLLYKNDGDTSEFIVAHRAADVGVKQTFPLLIEFSNFIMRGAV